MKLVTTLWLLLVLSVSAWAGNDATVVLAKPVTPTINKVNPTITIATDAITIPRLISYQGKLTDTLGIPVPDGNYSLTFRLYTQETGGTPFWIEAQTVAVRNGIFSVLLGAAIPIPQVPDAGDLYLGMQVGAGSELTPRLRIGSVPYAYLSERTANADALQGRDTTYFARATHTHPYVDSARISANTYQIEGNNLTTLDARWVNEGQTNAITSAMVQDGTILRADVAANFKAPYSDTADYARLAPATDSARVAANSYRWNNNLWGAVDYPKADRADTALYVAGANVAGEVAYANRADTAAVVTGTIAFADSARIAANSHKLQGKDTTALSAKFVDEGQTAGGDLTGTYPNPTIANNAVTSAKIQDGTIVRSDVAANFKAPYSDTADYARLAPATDSARVAANSHKLQGKDTTAFDSRYVNEGQANAITSAMIQDGAVQTADIANLAVTSVKIGNGEVTMAKINQSGATAGQVIKWNGTQWAPANDSAGGLPSGPAGGDLTGTYPNPTIANNAVTSAKIQDGTVANADLASNAVTSDKILDGTILAADLNQMGAATGQVLKWTGSAWAPRNDSVGQGDNAWVRGTPDSVLYTIRQLGIARGGAGNMLYGTYAHTHINLGVACTTGTSGENYDCCTVGGGDYNTASATNATVSGGYRNIASDFAATVSGGANNTASGYAATIGGGVENKASAIYTTVGGGYKNIASALGATVGGGYFDTASHQYATVAGGYRNTATAPHTTVGGGYDNTASVDYATVGGGINNIASGLAATVGGGYSDTASGNYATVAGGYINTASGPYTTIGGGYRNIASSYCATVGGGYSDTASGNYATIAGGHRNTARDTYAMVGGGYSNNASEYATTIGGGHDNTASGRYATVGGGRSNLAETTYTTVAGGLDNQATNEAASIGGGAVNRAGGYCATIAGGAYNKANGTYATVPGGYYNNANEYCSFAAGSFARANHTNSFVWSDSVQSPPDSVYTTGANQWRVRARGGVWFFSNRLMTSGVYLAPGSNSWSSACDSANKTDFQPVDHKALLKKLATVPVRYYRMKDQNDGTKHIGPVAQEFYAAFGVGENDKSINMADADGVLFAAIQALYQENQELRQELEIIKAKVGNRGR
ncbi:MAG: tail fiber domain-containing protein [candidate division WOR-3 bacterium]|nr:hypothetical protein [candidate division WOR-3 bacterium]MDH7518934.1 hypothetical protein [bacterium]